VFYYLDHSAIIYNDKEVLSTMRIQKQKNRFSKKTIIFTIATLITAVGSITLFTLANKYQQKSEANDNQSVNYEPPTEREITDSQKAKKNPPKEEFANEQGSTSSNPPQSNTDKKSVGVGIAFADIINNQLEIRAFTNSTIEGGECTATASKDNKKVIKKVRAFIDASSTQCEAIFIPKSELSNGTWSIEVEFSSSNAHGKSETIEVSV